MDNRERDTHFAIFAKLLYQELSDLNGGYETIISEDLNEKEQQEQLQIISQRAYDLVYHALMTASTVTLEHANLRCIDDEDMKDVPDITKWPEYDS